MELVESSREQRPRAKHDYMDDVQDAQVSREARMPGATGGSAENARSNFLPTSTVGSIVTRKWPSRATHDYMDAGGAIPWMESVESSREQRPRAIHDYMDVGGTIPWKESVVSSREQRPKATQDAKAEEQLPRTL